MLAFLNISAKYVFLIPIIVIVWTLLIGGPVTEMPFGTQEALDVIANGIANVIHIMPFMDVVFDVIIWGVQIKVMLMIINILKFILDLFVQS